MGDMRKTCCDFRNRTGPLRSPDNLYPRVHASMQPYFQQRIKQLFVERASCGMARHDYHLVCELTPTASRVQEWIYTRATAQQLAFLLGIHYHLADGFDGTETHFVLLPTFIHPAILAGR